MSVLLGLLLCALRLNVLPEMAHIDPEGTLFSEFFRQLNGNGLFERATIAPEFLAFYLSFDRTDDWTEADGYKIAEVWLPDA